jgi:hypothetical protein
MKIWGSCADLDRGWRGGEALHPHGCGAIKIDSFMLPMASTLIASKGKEKKKRGESSTSLEIQKQEQMKKYRYTVCIKKMRMCVPLR